MAKISFSKYLFSKRWNSFLLSFLALTFFFLFFTSSNVFAVSRYWVGSAGGNTNDTANWSAAQNSCGVATGASVPGSSDTAFFTSSCTNSATINATFTPQGVNLGAGYSGTVTQGSGISITIGSTGYTQAAGTFTGTNGAISSTGALSVTAGSFTSTSATLTLGAGFSITSTGIFAHNNGTILFNGSSAAVLACNTQTLNTVTITKSSSSTTVTVGSTCSVPLAGTNPSSTGTITNNGTITVTGNWTVTGSYISNSGAVLAMSGTSLTISVALTLNAGTVPAGLTTISVGGNLDNTGNVLPNGTDLSLVAGSLTSTITCGTATFNSVVINKASGSATTVIGSTCNFPLSGTNPTSTGNITNNGTISVTGDWSITSGALILNSGGAISITGTSLSVSGNLTLNGGTLPASLTTLVLGSGLNNTANILPNGIDLTINETATSASINCGTATFNSFTLNISSSASDVTPTSSCSMGNFTISGSGNLLNAGSAYEYTITGDLNQSGSGQRGGTNLTYIFSGTATQSFTQTSGSLASPLQINKSSGVAQLVTDIVSTSTCSVLSGTLFLNGKTPSCSSNIAVSNGATLQIIGSEHAVPTLNSGSIVKIVGDGDSSADTYALPSWSFSNLTISFIDSADNISPNNTLDTNLTGYWKMDEGSGSTVDDSSSNSNIGNITNAIFSSTAPTTSFSNPFSLSFDGAGDYLNIGSSLTLAQNKSAVSIMAWIRLNNVSGTKDIFGLSTGISNANSRANLQVSGDEVVCNARAGDAESSQSKTTSAANLAINTWYHVGCIIDYANDNINVYVNGVEYPATGSISFTAVATSNTVSLTSAIGIDEDKSGNDFSGFIDEVRFYDRSLTRYEIGVMAIGNNTSLVTSTTIGNTFTQTLGGFTAPSTMNIAGNWARSGGTFTHNSGTVVLNGGDQTITGTSTFYNLIKNVSTQRTLTFPAGVTQTIVGTTSLKGISSAILYLVSGSAPTQWRFDPQGTRDIEYVNVTDSYNTNGTLIAVTGNNIENGGNNTGWNFDTTAPSAPGIPSTTTPTSSLSQTWNWLAATDAGSGVASYAWRVIDSLSNAITNSTTAATSVITNLTNGVYTFFVKATDNAGNVGSESSGSLTVDSTAPSIPGTPSSASATDDDTPTWTWTASTDSGVGLTTPAYSIEWSQDINFASGVFLSSVNTNTYTHSTSLSGGTWYFRVKASDLVGNESNYSGNGSFTINTDSNSPTGSISINAGSSYTTNALVTLTLSASDNVDSTGSIQMKVSENSNFSGANYESFSSSKSWTLSANDGTKSVYVRFKDTSGNESDSYSATIILDTTSPLGFNISSPGNLSYISTNRPGIKWKSTTDQTSGLSTYKVEIEAGFNTNGNRILVTIDDIPVSRLSTYDTSKFKVEYDGFDDNNADNNYITVTTKSSVLWGLNSTDGEMKEGKRIIKVRAVDNAGNTREETAEVFVDNTSPDVTLLHVNAIETYYNNVEFFTADVTPTLQGTITDYLSGENESNKVTSGPKEVLISVKKQNILGAYADYITGSIVVDTAYFTKDSSIISDNTINNSSKYGYFEYTPETALPGGLYEISIKGKDTAGNTGIIKTYFLTIEPYDSAVNTDNRDLLNDLVDTEFRKLPKEQQTTINKQKIIVEVKKKAPITKKQLLTVNPFKNLFTSIGNGLYEGTRNIYYFTSREVIIAAKIVSAPVSYLISSVTPESVKFRMGQNEGLQSFLAKTELISAIVLDKEPTTISNLKVKSSGKKYAIITWETNHPATSKVSYGDSYDYGRDVQSTKLTKRHEIKITGLKENTSYYYEVMSYGKTYAFDARHEFKTTK